MADTNVVTWHLNGEQIAVDLFDIDGLEWREAKRVSGLPRQELVAAALTDGDFEAIAALIWIVRRRDDAGLDYEAVLGGLNLAAMQPPKKTSRKRADPPG